MVIGINSMLLGYDLLEVYDLRMNFWLVKNFILEGYCELWVIYNFIFFEGFVYFSFIKDGYLGFYIVDCLEWSMIL